MKTIMIILWLELFLMASVEAHAGNVVGLTPFTANTTAKASEVNGNFNAVKTAVDDNYSRLTAAGAVSLSAYAFSEGFNNTIDSTGCHLSRTAPYAHFLESGRTCTAVAPISLPHGTTVTSISCLVYDYEGVTTPNISPIALNRTSLSVDFSGTIFGITTATTDVGLQTLTTNTANVSAVIDNNNYAYSVSVRFDLTSATSPYSLRLYGCTVTYQP